MPARIFARAMIGSTMESEFTEQSHVSPKPVHKHIGIIVSRRYAVVTKPAKTLTINTMPAETKIPKLRDHG